MSWRLADRLGKRVRLRDLGFLRGAPLKLLPRDEMEAASGTGFYAGGCLDPRGGAKGDLLILVSLEVPKTLSPKHEKLLRDMANEEKINVSPHRKSFLEKLTGYFVPAVEEQPRKEKKRG